METRGAARVTGPIMPSAEDQQIALIGKALSNPIRVQMLRFIGKEGSYCGDLTERFGLAQSTVSHHIRILKEAGLIHGEEQGTATCYRVDPTRCQEICRILQSTLEAVTGAKS
jgi:ArsR family transcriptional regulator